jgi:hypothetical protein
MTSNGMSWQGSKGIGSVVATIGLFIVVGRSIGAAVDRSCTFGMPTLAGGALCDTTAAAVTRAPSAASRRSLVTITPPPFGLPLRGVYKSQLGGHSGNENLF